MKFNLYAFTGGAVALVSSLAANAVIDVTSVTTAMTDALTAVGTIGGAILGVWAVRKAYNMIMR